MATSPAKRNILMISACGSFLAPFMVSALIVAIPAIGIEFSMSAVEMSWLATVFFMAASMFLIPFGRLADIFGVKKIFSIGIVIYFVSAAFVRTGTQCLYPDCGPLPDRPWRCHDLRNLFCSSQPIAAGERRGERLWA